jgi:hypothetical protein
LAGLAGLVAGVAISLCASVIYLLLREQNDCPSRDGVFALLLSLPIVALAIPLQMLWTPDDWLGFLGKASLSSAGSLVLLKLLLPVQFADAKSLLFQLIRNPNR